MAEKKITIRLLLDTKGYQKGAKTAATSTDKITKSATKTTGAMNGLSGSVGKVGIALGAAFVATKIVRFAGDAIQRAEDMSSAYAITEKILEQTGFAANVTADEIKELARQQAILTGIDKLMIAESNNILLTFKAVRNEVGKGNDIFNQASGLILDMATVMGTDAKSGAIQLGKALNDPILGVSALNRVGIQFTETQKEQIKNFQESGDVMSAQKIILAELEGQLGGTAEAAADDSAKITRAFDEIQESFGMKLLPFLALAAREVQSLFGQISKFQKLELITGQQIGTVEFAAGAIVKLAKDMERLDKDGKDFDGSIFASGVEEILDVSELTSEELVILRDNIGLLEEKFNVTGAEAELLADIIRGRLTIEALGGVDGPIQSFNFGLTAVGRIAEATRGPLQSLATDIENAGVEAKTADRRLVTKGIKNLREAYRTAAAAIRDVKKALLEATSPTFAAISAVERQTDAEERLAEILKEQPDDLHAIALAQAEVAEATITTESALLNLGDGDVFEALDVIGTALGFNRQQTLDWGNELRILDGTKVRVELELGGVVTPEIFEAAGGLAHGGPVIRGQPVIVGEEGPEVFIPASSGQIIPNSSITTGAGVVASDGGGDQNITFVTSGDPVEDAQLVSLMLANRSLVRGGLRGGAF